MGGISRILYKYTNFQLKLRLVSYNTGSYSSTLGKELILYFHITYRNFSQTRSFKLPYYFFSIFDC